MTPLEMFLKAEDLDDVLRARRGIATLTPEETGRVASIIRDWTDRQAVANLLFHPGLIPADLRFEALDRGLNSIDVPYFALAATVGCQGIALKDIPDHARANCLRMLMQFVQLTSSVFAGRASLTLFTWAQTPEPHDVLPELLALYPVPDESASRNIVAAALARSADMPAEEFDRQLTRWRVSAEARTALENAHREYETLKGHDELRARLLKHPTFCYIPNLAERPAN
jgi:hypothetical protein